MKSRQITIVITILIIIEIELKGIESTCGIRLVGHTPLITNGLPSNEGDWPWHAAIFHTAINQDLSYKCGGTVLDSDSVLTAAHCVYENNRPIIPERVSVQLGKYSLKVYGTNTQYFEVFNIIPHPNYNSSDLSNDIAIIRLATQATVNNYVQPICLSNKLDIEEISGKLGTVIGWGVTETDQLSNVLRQAYLPVVSSITCLESNRYFYGAFLSEKNFCAGFRNGTSVCNGDSGGGIFFKENGMYYIRGIVSLAMSREDMQLCSTKDYVIFTNVARYLPWIEKLVHNLQRLPSEAFRLAASTEIHSTQIKLFINDATKMAYAEISNGDPKDDVWMDLSFDGGINFKGSQGRAAIASGFNSVCTSYVSLENGGRDGIIRAGGIRHGELKVTSYQGAHWTGNVLPSEAFRLAASAEVFRRQIKLYINDADKTAYAEISNGDPTDEVWMDLSFDGGSNFEGNLGRAAIAGNFRSVRTIHLSLRNGGRDGVLRAGGKAGNRVEIALTSWEGAHYT